MINIGIDIGTSKICGVALRDGIAVKVAREDNVFALKGKPYESLQDPEGIYAAVLRILEQLTSDGPAASIGLTGQMHGVLYVSGGKAVSPLFTWQDRRGDLPCGEGSFVEKFSALTGRPLATGYGLVTHCCLGGAYRGTLSTIHAYVAMRLAGRSEPVLHRSDAASLGFYNLGADGFDRSAVRLCGGDPSAIPHVAGDEPLGKNVITAIGDNQAAVYDALGLSEGLCVNIGTGSQISAVTGRPVLSGETRPYVCGKYLAVGSALCGGRAYALIKDCVAEIISEVGSDADAYDLLGRLASQASGTVKCVPTFAGTRTDPSATGSFSGITTDNFRIGELAYAVLRGMAEELYGAYSAMKSELPVPDKIVCAGNGMRRNPLLMRIVSEVFALPATLTPHEEEAASGAATYAAAVMKNA